jgi:hypothetical protein
VWAIPTVDRGQSRATADDGLARCALKSEVRDAVALIPTAFAIIAVQWVASAVFPGSYRKLNDPPFRGIDKSDRSMFESFSNATFIC